MEQAVNQILRACHELKEEKLILRTWGNVSARLDDGGFLITPSGRDYDVMTGDDLVCVSKKLTWEEGKKPSSEKGMHARLYAVRPECGFIVHTHQTNASAVSLMGEDIFLAELPESIVTNEERKLLGNVIPCAKYGLSSTNRLAKNVAAAAEKYRGSRAVLMRYHGAVLLGDDCEQAMAAARALEVVCGKIYEKKCGEKIERQTEDAGLIGAEIEFGYLLHVRTPFIMEMSMRGKVLMPYLDDMAQIGGTRTECLPENAGFRKLLKKLTVPGAVMIEGKGAYCMAHTKDEAEAVGLALEKNCFAANLALKKAISPVPALSAKIERTFYLRKYSKLKQK